MQGGAGEEDIRRERKDPALHCTTTCSMSSKHICTLKYPNVTTLYNKRHL